MREMRYTTIRIRRMRCSITWEALHYYTGGATLLRDTCCVLEKILWLVCSPAPPPAAPATPDGRAVLVLTCSGLTVGLAHCRIQLLKYARYQAVAKMGTISRGGGKR